MKILKFGGTSVGSAHNMRLVANLISAEEPKMVVLSAMSGTTNKLVEIANKLYQQQTKEALDLTENLHKIYREVINELYTTEKKKFAALDFLLSHIDFIKSLATGPFSIREERAILAQGELLSTHLFQFLLEELNQNSVLLPALSFMRIDENEEPDLTFLEEELTALLAKYPQSNLFITQGYICRNAFGEIDNLKRGGSDYSASLIGAAVQASEIQIWTDIDGMHNNDPRVVPDTYPIAELSFDEAAELAYFGAKILHPSSVLPAKQKNIPVKLLNTMQPEAKGTTISAQSSGKSIKAVAAKDGIVAINVKSSRMLLAYGFLRRIFEVFEEYKTPIDMVTTSEVAVSLTIDNTKYLPEIIAELKEFGSVQVDTDQTIICLVGDSIEEVPGTTLKIFKSLKDIPLRMISYGGSKNNISLLIATADKKQALKALNTGVFERIAEHA
ncbi:aspartate kinase [Adhaeribacter pallidiroseus]|uniref:Aspartokinase n=1 Tax=Adhaeribacter pallidiroseus TaxID=2072847 RepID=A0A369QC17_9BACT|nr:aspartate kinase [Adhaeribacter pallidiroseus]RDC62443.1 Aspartate kinase [Adhaeribacter pallidiroseus]